MYGTIGNFLLFTIYLEKVNVCSYEKLIDENKELRTTHPCFASNTCIYFFC